MQRSAAHTARRRSQAATRRRRSGRAQSNQAAILLIDPEQTPPGEPVDEPAKVFTETVRRDLVFLQKGVVHRLERTPGLEKMPDARPDLVEAEIPAALDLEKHGLPREVTDEDPLGNGHQSREGHR